MGLENLEFDFYGFDRKDSSFEHFFGKYKNKELSNNIKIL
jgi:hypothetical protein